MAFHKRKKITVVFVERVAWGGGAERVILDIASKLDRKRFKCLIVLLYEGRSAPRNLRRNIRFKKLVPESFSEFIIAALENRLGEEFKYEYRIAVDNLHCKIERLKIQFSLVYDKIKFKIYSYILRIAQKLPENKFKEILKRCRDILIRRKRERQAIFRGKSSIHRKKCINSTISPSFKEMAERLFSHIHWRARWKNLLMVVSTKQVCSYITRRLCEIFGISDHRQKYVPSDIQRASSLGKECFESKRRTSHCDSTKNDMLEKICSKPQNDTLTYIPYLHRRPIDIRRQSRLFAEMANRLEGPVVIIPVMEEAASMVRLSIGASPNSRWPYILSTHAWESYYLPIMYGCNGFEVLEEKALFSSACCGAEAVLSPSNGCRDDLIHCLDSPIEKTICLPNPVDIETIRKKSFEKFSIPLPEKAIGKKLFLHVGRLDPQKRHDILFTACSQLIKRYPEFHLICLGEGPNRGELDKMIDEMDLGDFVTMLGFVNNPYPYMRHADALVLSSESESFSLVLAEAIICGCVPVATNCPHGPKDILDNGKGGFLVEDDSPEAFADAMYKAVMSETLVEKKLLYASKWIERYDLKRIVDQWEKLLTHIAITYHSPY